MKVALKETAPQIAEVTRPLSAKHKMLRIFIGISLVDVANCLNWFGCAEETHESITVTKGLIRSHGIPLEIVLHLHILCVN